MLVVIPDILKKNQDQWHFSDKEPWKPVAKETASEDVKKAIADYVKQANQ